MPPPSLLGGISSTDGVSDKAYPDREAYREHLIELLNEDARALAAAGVYAIQLTRRTTPTYTRRNQARGVLLLRSHGSARAVEETAECAASRIPSCIYKCWRAECG